jgi:hypothetical protein
MPTDPESMIKDHYDQTQALKSGRMLKCLFSVFGFTFPNFFSANDSALGSR